MEKIYRERPYCFSLFFFTVFFLSSNISFANSYEPTFNSVLKDVLNGCFAQVPEPYSHPNNINQCAVNSAILIGQTIKSVTIGTEVEIEKAEKLVHIQLNSGFASPFDRAVARASSALIEILDANYIGAVFDVYQLYKILKNENPSGYSSEFNALKQLLNQLYAKMPVSMASVLRFSGFKPLTVEYRNLQPSELADIIELFSEIVINNHEPASLNSNSTLSKILVINYYLKNNQPKVAEQVFESIDTTRNGLPVLWYLKGQTDLYTGDYKSAGYYFSKFLFLQPEGNFVKSAVLRKKWIAIILQKDFQNFEQFILQRGNARLYTDKQALVEATTIYNSYLLQARIAFDGGDYNRVFSVLTNLNHKKLNNSELVEYHYRLARTNQQLKNFKSALVHYDRVIELPNKGGYFHKKSALESGKIYFEMGNYVMAEKWFQRVGEIKSIGYGDVMDDEAENFLEKTSR